MPVYETLFGADRDSREFYSALIVGNVYVKIYMRYIAYRIAS